MQAETIIRNARVIDGTGNPWYRANLGIGNGRILWVVPAAIAVEGRLVIDAADAVLAPGFIDIHAHSDLSLFSFPLAESKLLQGVTTEVSGNCGWSAAPLSPEMEAEMRAEHPAPDDVPWGFRTLAEYLEAVEAHRPAINFACHVGHGAVRQVVMGTVGRPASPSELEAMSRLVEEALDAGAVGLSSGLIYSPGCYAPPEELEQLAAVAFRRGRLYASHIRGEGETLEQAVAEAIAVGHRVGGPVQIAHHKASGRPNWGKVRRTLAMVDEARARGVDVTLDQYPYVASSTDLTAYLPAWAREGGKQVMLGRLRDPESRARIRQELRQPRGEAIEVADWSPVVLSFVRGKREWEGRSIRDIAEELGREPAEAVMDLLLEEDGVVGVVHFGMNEADVRSVMSHPAVMVGSDGSALAPDPAWGRPHPRSYGTFVRVLGRYVREEKVLTLEEAVRKMTGFPASRLGLAGRGRIAAGCWADLVLFDPATCAEGATFTDPCRYPQGIRLVMVNGRIAARDGQPTGERAGKVLRAG